MIDTNKPTGNEIVVTAARPKSVLIDMADRYGMEPTPFEATVRAICMPANTSREEFAAFLLVAKEYRLNPLTKEIYAFPKRGGGIVPIVSVDGWLSLINSHPACDGFTFSWLQDDKGDPISCTCIMYRKDRSHPVEVTEYLSECYRPTDPWKMKHRMLRHKALIQCGRYAFGFSGIYDEDEGEKIAEARDITPSRPTPPSPPAEDEPDPIPSGQKSGGTNSTIPDGRENEHETLGRQAYREFKTNLAAAKEAIGDFNDDDTGLTSEPAMPADAYFTRLDEELAPIDTEDALIAHLETLQVEAALEGNDKALDRAAGIRKKHLDRVTGQGDLLGERPFPADLPLTKAAKIAGTP